MVRSKLGFSQNVIFQSIFHSLFHSIVLEFGCYIIVYGDLSSLKFNDILISIYETLHNTTLWRLLNVTTCVGVQFEGSMLYGYEYFDR